MKDKDIVGVLCRVDNAWGKGYEIFCPGCGFLHYIAVELAQRNGAQWTFDGNHQSPTFSPSLLMNIPEDEEAGFEHPAITCHSFIRVGHWEFLGDCTHALKGQRVPIPPYPASVKTDA
jgi:hypothetical protein